MPRIEPSPRPTDAELAILRILWDRGPSTVRQVHDVLCREPPRAYTTALKLLQIMSRKGTGRARRTRPDPYLSRAAGRRETQRQLVRDLADRAFGGSATKLVMQALASRRASADELRDIRRAIDKPSNEREGRRDDRD